MEKIRLTLDDLTVQSFATVEGGANASGTVHGQENTNDINCYTGDPNGFTCADYGCAWGSGYANTCDGSCDCLSAACGGSDGCPSGGYCNSFYASGCRY